MNLRRLGKERKIERTPLLLGGAAIHGGAAAEMFREYDRVDAY
jgi:hypothetical protein